MPNVTVQPKFCGTCGRQLVPGAAFCGICGSPVAPKAAAESASQPEPVPQPAPQPEPAPQPAPVPTVQAEADPASLSQQNASAPAPRSESAFPPVDGAGGSSTGSGKPAKAIVHHDLPSFSFLPFANEEKAQEIEGGDPALAFAEGLPEWSLEPPQVLVARPRRA